MTAIPESMPLPLKIIVFSPSSFYVRCLIYIYKKNHKYNVKRRVSNKVDLDIIVDFYYLGSGNEYIVRIECMFE